MLAAKMVRLGLVTQHIGYRPKAGINWRLRTDDTKLKEIADSVVRRHSELSELSEFSSLLEASFLAQVSQVFTGKNKVPALSLNQTKYYVKKARTRAGVPTRNVKYGLGVPAKSSFCASPEDQVTIQDLQSVDQWLQSDDPHDSSINSVSQLQQALDTHLQSRGIAPRDKLTVILTQPHLPFPSKAAFAKDELLKMAREYVVKAIRTAARNRDQVFLTTSTTKDGCSEYDRPCGPFEVEVPFRLMFERIISGKTVMDFSVLSPAKQGPGQRTEAMWLARLWRYRMNQQFPNGDQPEDEISDERMVRIIRNTLAAAPEGWKPPTMFVMPSALED